MTAFEERVADTVFDQADAEFAALGREAGVPVVPAREVLAEPTPIAQKREGHGYAGPVARDASSFRRRAPQLAREDEDAPDVSRKLRRGSGRREIKFSTELVPIDVTNASSGKTWTLWARRVPATEMGYLERLENILADIRLLMRRIEVKSESDQRKLDKLNDRYNATAEEYLAFQLEMPEGFYADLNTAGLTQLQRQLAEIMRGDDGDQAEDDAGN
jgi:hypothetical protein